LTSFENKNIELLVYLRIISYILTYYTSTRRVLLVYKNNNVRSLPKYYAPSIVETFNEHDFWHKCYLAKINLYIL